MRVILVSVGTIGDTLPFLGIGRELLSRGHEVFFLGNGAYRAQAKQAGVEFVELISPAESERQAAQRGNWHCGWKAMREGFANLLQDVPTVYRAIADLHQPGRTVVAATGLMFGARIAQEKFGLPTVTVHLQPAGFRTERDPVYWSKYVPECLIREMYRVGDAVVDFQLARPLNDFRSKLGLPPIRGVMNDWWNSPQSTVGAFPAFFAPSRRAWPSTVRFVGFPMYHGVDDFPEAERLQSFLERRPRPIVICPTSAIDDARALIGHALEAVRRLNRPAVVLASRLDALPATLPDQVAHFRFVPNQRLLPHAGALVHNGGIGTTAAALHAGIPQLVVPRILDQPDNARRLRGLGVAEVLSPRQCRAESLTNALRRLLESSQTAERCRRYAAECARIDGIAATASEIERVGTAVG